MPKRSYAYPNAIQGVPGTLAFSPDSRMLAVESYGSVQFWDVATGQPGRILNNAEGTPQQQRWRASAFAFLPDGQTVVMAGWGGRDRRNPNYGKPIRFWDVTGGKLLWDLPCGGVGRNQVAISPSGRLLLEGGNIWDLKAIHRLRSIQIDHNRPTKKWDPTFSPDEKLIAAPMGDEVRVWEAVTGQEILTFRGHLSRICYVTFGPDSQTLASASDDRTAIVWDLRRHLGLNASPPAGVLGAEELNRLWITLNDKSAVAAYKGICRLIASPRETVPLLKHRLRPAPPRDVNRIRQLIEDLDSNQFTVRTVAAKALEKLCFQAEPELRETLKTTRSAEVRRQVRALLKFPAVAITEPAYIREIRALQVLENIGSPEAREILEIIARGEPLANLTHEARESLERLDRKQRKR